MIFFTCCFFLFFFFFFFNDTATTEIYTLSLHDALPICCRAVPVVLIQLTGNESFHSPATGVGDGADRAADGRGRIRCALPAHPQLAHGKRCSAWYSAQCLHWAAGSRVGVLAGRAGGGLWYLSSPLCLAGDWRGRRKTHGGGRRAGRIPALVRNLFHHGADWRSHGLDPGGGPRPAQENVFQYELHPQR